MKAQTLLALVAAIAPTFCNSADFAKPFVLDFYQKDKGSYTWTDLTGTKDDKKIDDGESPNKDDPSFLGHFTFHSTDEVKRTYHWRSEDVHEITCDVVVSGDPLAAGVIYHMDTRTFESQGGELPDLSVVHVRCRLPPKRGEEGDPEFGFDDPTFNPDDSTYGLHYGSFDADANVIKVEPPPLADTDLEQVLNVIFQISDQPVTKADLATKELSKTFWWDQLPDKSMSAEEVDYEAYKSRRARETYSYLQRMSANEEPTDTDRLLERKVSISGLGKWDV